MLRTRSGGTQTTPPATHDSEDTESDEEDNDEGELDSTGRLFVALITSETPPEDSSTDNLGSPSRTHRSTT